MPAFCSLLLPINYAKNFAGKIDGSLVMAIHLAKPYADKYVCEVLTCFIIICLLLGYFHSYFVAQLSFYYYAALENFW